MESRKIEINFLVWQHENELPKEEFEMLQHAKKATENSHAPYSNFHVGAAVLLENGKFILGSNQENASYPAGVCAEMVAVTHIGANHPNQIIKSVAITTRSVAHKTDTPAAPCGLCRQSMLEYEVKQKSPISIILKGESGKIYKISSVADLMPLAFTPDFLGV